MICRASKLMRIAAATLCCVVFPAITAHAKPTYLNRPAINPDATLIAFCVRGDIWLVAPDGTGLRRLTDHVAYDTAPVFSPTSDRLAFSSDREGGMDVYVMPVAGGEPRRLTFHSAHDHVCGFTPFGNKVLFKSRRDTRRHRVYAVSVKGGEPAPLLPYPAHHLAFSPDGDAVAFTLGAMHWWRRGYRGSANFDIWIKPLDGGRAEKLTSWKGNDTDVMWGADKRLYFVSDRNGMANLWRRGTGPDDKATELTHHKRHPVLFPSMSANGKAIVYTSLEGGLYLLDVETGKTRVAPVTIRSDVKENRTERRTFTADASEIAPSPDGKQLALAIRGDLFVVAKKGGKARRVTDTPCREKHPAWSPDGNSLYFSSDRSGSAGIYRLRSDEEGVTRLDRARFFKTEKIFDTPLREEAPRPAPDGRNVLFLVGLGDLWICPTGGGEARRLAKGPFVEDPAWSPDSRWIAFSKTEKDWNTEIYVVPAEGGDPVNITRDPDDDRQPAFGPRGEHLYFSSSRGGGERFNIHRLALTKRIWQRDRQEHKEKEEDEDRDDKIEKGDKAGKKDHDDTVPDVKIDFDDIDDRAERITSTRGNDTLPVLHHNGKTLFFTSNSLGFHEIWKSATDGGSLERLTRSRDHPDQMFWNEEQKTLIYRRGGRAHTLTPDGARGTIGHRAEMTIDIPAERLVAFDEAWRLLRDYFYDKDMHGVDWERCRKEYLALCQGTSCTEDFNDVVSMMLGELSASHLGIYGPGSGRSPDPTGLSGITFEAGPLGKRYRVARVLKDSPADREASKVAKGEFLVSVDREPVEPGQNLARLFNGKVDEKVDLEFSDAEQGGELRTVTLRLESPGAVNGLLYESWVDENRRKVETLSGGTLGYIHIRSMSGRSFDRFRRDYLAKVRDLEGLVLDVRDNPGGYIHNQLWELLAKRKPVGYYRIRGAEVELQPDHTWRKPVVLLINERSASDAEIFPWGFRRLGLGKVIGQPTWGGVIGTGGTSLINGAWLRLPYVGWYTDDHQNLENLGVEPDIFVVNHPDDVAKGKDAQLERAVEEILGKGDEDRKK